MPFSGLVFECVVPGSIPLEHLLFDPIRLIHVKLVVHSLRQLIRNLWPRLGDDQLVAEFVIATVKVAGFVIV